LPKSRNLAKFGTKSASRIGGFLVYPAKLALRFTELHLENPNRSTTIILVVVISLIWIAYVPTTLIKGASAFTVVVISLIFVIVFSNVIQYISGWHIFIRTNFEKFDLPARFDFIGIERLGSRAIVVVLAINFVFGLLDIAGVATSPAILVGVPYALFLAGRVVFRLRIPRENIIHTMKAGLSA